ncbi:MAG: hypothetical protein RLY31_96 [Bacteroidota bacterium]
MHTILAKFIAAVNVLNEWIGRAVSWLTLVLIGLICLDVVGRKFFSFTRAWVNDLEWHLFALIFLLGSGYALRHGRHVRVDLFYDRFSNRDRALVDAWGSLLFLVPWCLVVMYFGTRYAWESFLFREGSPEPGGLPARYVIKATVVLGALLLLLQGLAILVEKGMQLKGERAHGQEAESVHQTPDRHGR